MDSTTNIARGRLTPQLIAETAFAIVDRDGPAGLSMRRLADELGVHATAFYKHMPSKQALIDGVLEVFFERIELPMREGADWEEWYRGLARSARRGFLTHPNLFDLLMANPGAGPSREVYDAFIGTMRAGGFHAELTHTAWHLLLTHVIGYVYQERGRRGAARRELAAPDGPSLQHVDRLAAEIAACDLADQFERGLAMVIRSLGECRLSQPPT